MEKKRGGKLGDQRQKTGQDQEIFTRWLKRMDIDVIRPYQLLQALEQW